MTLYPAKSMTLESAGTAIFAESHFGLIEDDLGEPGAELAILPEARESAERLEDRFLCHFFRVGLVPQDRGSGHENQSFIRSDEVHERILITFQYSLNQPALGRGLRRREFKLRVGGCHGLARTEGLSQG